MEVYGLVNKYKYFLLAKGFSQDKGINYNGTFALVVKMDHIKLDLAIVVARHWEVQQIDVKSEFIHGYIEENI